METCNTFWMGPLGALERACLRSMLRQGHPVRLWCYDLPSGVPSGIEIGDAEQIVPKAEVVFHQSGSVALFANRIRYELQRRSMGIWVDCDVYLVRPLQDLPALVLGRVDDNEINNAVLRLPPNSPMLGALLRLFEDREVPPWLPQRARWLARIRLAATGRAGLSRMPWGSAGPRAITWLARHHGLDREVLPEDCFYPKHWKDADWIRDPAVSLDDVVKRNTRAVHLWNELIKSYKDQPAPLGSFLARLQEEGS